MTFLEDPHLIMVDGWRKISFYLDGEYRHIPTDRMINDLHIPPTPSNGWDTLPPDVFDKIPAENMSEVNALRQEIDEIFNDPNASWMIVRKCMLQEKYRTLIAGVLSPLYREVALRSYRIPRVDDADSVKALQEFSNIVVLGLTNVAAEKKSLEKRLFETHFTTAHYKWFLYLILVECYCIRVLPCPVNKAFNRLRDYKLFDALLNLLFSAEADPSGAAGNALKTKLACYSRFADWRMTRKIAAGLNTEILSHADFLKSFKKSGNDSLYQAIGENIKAQRGDRTGEYTKLLHQCLFCYRFRLVERKGNGLS